jgi:hypothetical protein
MKAKRLASYKFTVPNKNGQDEVWEQTHYEGSWAEVLELKEQEKKKQGRSRKWDWVKHPFKKRR